METYEKTKFCFAYNIFQFVSTLLKRKRRLICIFKGYTSKFNRHSQMMIHLKSDHKLKGQLTQILSLRSINAFNDWKDALQVTTLMASRFSNKLEIISVRVVNLVSICNIK